MVLKKADLENGYLSEAIFSGAHSVSLAGLLEMSSQLV